MDTQDDNVARPCAAVKRLRVVLGVFVVALAGGIAWHGMSPSEPVYKGKSFSVWLEEWARSPIQKNPVEAVQAIQHIGTNGIPCMLRMLATKDSPMKKRIKGLVNKQTLIGIHWRDEMITRECASMAFELFGPEARPAVPGLIKLLSHEDRNIRWRALEALRFIGPSASNAIPALTQLLGDKDERFVEDVRRTLNVIDKNRASSYEMESHTGN